MYAHEPDLSAVQEKNSFFIETFGCQMNVNDSEKVAGLLLAEGYEPAASPEEATFVFLNTCAVREMASEKLFHALGRLRQIKKRRPELIIGVGGCVAQLQGREVLERASHVDVLVGTHNVARVPELVRRAREGFSGCVDLDRTADSFAIPMRNVAHSNAVRAYVVAIEGCNHVCSFCVVPRTRGPEVCRNPDDIVAEVHDLVSRGYAEVMLLGQTVNAYQHGNVDFAGLLERVHQVEGLRRLRFMTSHPEHVTERMIHAWSRLPNLCPYLHLPVQSGSNRILASMRRGYTVGEYRATIARLREQRADLALTTDVIVGYPGESNEDFEQTLRLIEEVKFDGLFIFTYSPRPGTSAFRLDDDVEEPEKRRRLQVLNTYQQRLQAEQNRARIGRREQILVDAVNAKRGRVSGRTADFHIVHLDGSAELLGRLLDVEIIGAGRNSLSGRAAASPF